MAPSVLAQKVRPASGFNPPAAHIAKMAEKSRTKLLEVSVVERGPLSWEWRVHTGDDVLVCGFESSRLAARVAGYDTIFSMLAGGWR